MVCAAVAAAFFRCAKGWAGFNDSESVSRGTFPPESFSANGYGLGMTIDEARARIAEIDALLLLPQETSITAGGVTQTAKRDHEQLRQERDRLIRSVNRARSPRPTRGVYHT